MKNTAIGIAIASGWLIFILMVVINAYGCATWATTTDNAIGTAHHVGVTLREVTLPVIDRRCSAAVSVCLNEDRADACPEFTDCKELRAQLGEALVRYQQSLKVFKQVLDGLNEMGVSDGSE